MCGIAGFAGLNDEPLLREMTRALAHRGPDDEGFYHRDGAGLGSRRLSIIDLAGGRQPIAGESGTVVVFNGEIYNFQELRRELERKGHRFTTRADTEAIVHLYEEKGIAGLKELSGMFALALWDPGAGRLVLARDPLGVKPLYYAEAGGRLYFGSELKALRKVPGLSFELDLSALDHYLDFLYVPSPATIYRGIRKLRPGEWLCWSGGKVEKGVYWSPFGRAVPGGEKRDRAVVAAELDVLLARVVREQAVSDVPIGLLLSGGLDSSVIAYCLARAGLRPEAFCASFASDDAFDELEKAKSVAGSFGLTLHEFRVEPRVEDVLDTMVEAFDEPMSDSSALPTYWISRLARRHVKVALTGIGGDEAFGGYPRYVGAALLEGYRRLPGPALKTLARLGRAVPERVSSRNVGGWLRRFLIEGAKAPAEAYAAWVGHLSAEDKAAIYGPGLRDKTSRVRAPLAAFAAAEGGGGDFLAQVLAVDLATYLPEDLLTMADRVSMAVSLELRVPLCDQRVVEFALGLPSGLRVGGTSLKPLLRDILRGKVPPEIVSQKKQGFMVPIGKWFRAELAPLVRESVEAVSARGLLMREGLAAIVAQHQSGRRNRTDFLWAVVLLEHWLKRYHPDFRLDRPPRLGKGRGWSRLLMVSDYLFKDDQGGAARVAWEAAKGLRDAGVEVRFCCLSRRPGLAPRETVDGIEVLRLAAEGLSSSLLSAARFPGAARRALDGLAGEFAPERVLTHQPFTAWVVQAHPAFQPARFTHFYHSSWAEEYRVDRSADGGPRRLARPLGAMARRWLERRVLERADSVVTLSRHMAEDVRARYGLAAGKVASVPSGVDLERFTPGDRAAARLRLGVEGGPVLVTVRNLRARMGLDLLLEAAALLRGEFPGLRVLIAGDGYLEARLRARAAELGLGQAARFLGRVPDEDLPDLYRCADLFVLPTRELEGLGLVLLEALASGIPCVGTPVGGIPEVLGRDWLADDVSASSLSRAVAAGLGRKTSPEELREFVASRYGWEKLALALEGLL